MSSCEGKSGDAMAGDWRVGKAAARVRVKGTALTHRCQVCRVTSMFRRVCLSIRKERKYSNTLGCFLNVYFSFFFCCNSRNGLRYGIVTIPKPQ